MGKRRYGREQAFVAEVGQQLLAARQKRGLSRSRLSEAVGITHVTLCRYESGEVAIPLFRLLRVAGYLKVTLADVVGPALTKMDIYNRN